MIFLLFIRGTPKPQPRPRIARGRAYNPPTADSWRLCVSRAGKRSGQSFTGPVRVSITFNFVRPPSHFLRGDLRATAPRYPARVGDIDNLIKSTLDALNGVLWYDDEQVVDIRAARVYAASAGAKLAVVDA